MSIRELSTEVRPIHPAVRVLTDRCAGCQECVIRCPTGALSMDTERWVRWRTGRPLRRVSPVRRGPARSRPSSSRGHFSSPPASRPSSPTRRTCSVTSARSVPALPAGQKRSPRPTAVCNAPTRPACGAARRTTTSPASSPRSATATSEGARDPAAHLGTARHLLAGVQPSSTVRGGLQLVARRRHPGRHRTSRALRR